MSDYIIALEIYKVVTSHYKGKIDAGEMTPADALPYFTAAQAAYSPKFDEFTQGVK